MQSIWPLFSMVFLLGLRHGFDLDHLATIDAMAQNTRAERPRIARFCGFFFSLGHGMVVIVVCFAVAYGFANAEFPPWLEHLGQGISVAFLLFFSLLTLYNLKGHSHGSARHQLFQRLLPQRLSPFWMMGIGALFALSFDTFSQVAVFSLSANQVSGEQLAILLGVIFMGGMMCSDGLNGWVVARLLRRADGIAPWASKVCALLVAGFSAWIAILGIIELTGNS